MLSTIPQTVSEPEREGTTGTLGLQFELPSLGFAVFPNPTKDAITVQLPGTGGRCAVYDHHGALLLNKEVKTTSQIISLMTLAPAEYFVRLTWQGRSYRQTITHIP